MQAGCQAESRTAASEKSAAVVGFVVSHRAAPAEQAEDLHLEPPDGGATASALAEAAVLGSVAAEAAVA